MRRLLVGSSMRRNAALLLRGLAGYLDDFADLICPPDRHPAVLSNGDIDALRPERASEAALQRLEREAGQR